MEGMLKPTRYDNGNSIRHRAVALDYCIIKVQLANLCIIQVLLLHQQVSTFVKQTV